MSADTPIPAVDHGVQVPLAPDDAFALFTRAMGAWWPFAGHSCSDTDGLDVQFEPRVGGAVTELSCDGRRFLWGHLTEWNPPHAFAMRWHPGLPADQATRLRVTFQAQDQGTHVRVLHDGWEARGEEAARRSEPYREGWLHTLQAYRQAAAQKETS